MNKKSVGILIAVLVLAVSLSIVYAAAESKDQNSPAGIKQDPNSQKQKDPNASQDPNSPKKVDHYVGSTEKMKFHTPDCKWVAKIPEASKKIFKTKEEAIATGMTACKTCNP
jgi:hypothetical protein